MMNTPPGEERGPKQATRATYDASAVALAEYFRGIGSRVVDIDRALSLAGKQEGVHALELGCGDGRDGSAIHERVATYLGLDYSPGMINVAREAFPAINFKVGDMLTTDFPPNQDVIYAFASILHLDKDELRTVLEKCFQSLNDNGVLYLSTKYKPEYTPEWKDDKYGSRLFYFYSPDEILDLVPDGFEEAYREMYVIHNTDWFSQAFKKKVSNEKVFNMKENIAFKGRIFEIVQTEQHDGRVFEVARRAPGVRLIIANKDEQKVLLTREFRAELNGWDYRLPGGKVFDTLDEFETYRAGGQDIVDAAISKAKAEGAEEAGVEIKEVELIGKSTLGATVEWDLYVFEATNWSEHTDGQRLEEGEIIEADNWLSFDEAKQLILSGGMQEERIALALLRWLESQGK